MRRTKRIFETSYEIEIEIPGVTCMPIDCEYYTLDKTNGRCYMLVDSQSLAPEMDMARVKKRISRKAFEKILADAKTDIMLEEAKASF